MTWQIFVELFRQRLASLEIWLFGRSKLQISEMSWTQSQAVNILVSWLYTESSFCDLTILCLIGLEGPFYKLFDLQWRGPMAKFTDHRHAFMQILDTLQARNSCIKILSRLQVINTPLLTHLRLSLRCCLSDKTPRNPFLATNLKKLELLGNTEMYQLPGSPYLNLTMLALKHRMVCCCVRPEEDQGAHKVPILSDIGPNLQQLVLEGPYDMRVLHAMNSLSRWILTFVQPKTLSMRIEIRTVHSYVVL